MRKPIYWVVFGIAILVAIAVLTMLLSKPQLMMNVSGARALDPTSAPSVPQPVRVDRTIPATATAPAATADPKVAATAPNGAVTAAQPIDVTPGFEFLAEPPGKFTDTDWEWTLWRRHQQLQSEPRDPSWSERMERELRAGIQGELTSHGYDTQRVELPLVECRTTGCEIQALGYPQDNMKQGVNLQTILPKLLMGPLAGEFDESKFSAFMSSTPEDRLTYLVSLPRKKT